MQVSAKWLQNYVDFSLYLYGIKARVVICYLTFSKLPATIQSALLVHCAYSHILFFFFLIILYQAFSNALFFIVLYQYEVLQLPLTMHLLSNTNRWSHYPTFLRKVRSSSRPSS